MLLTFVISMCAILALGASVYFAVSTQLDADTRTFVRSDASDLAATFRKSGRNALFDELNSRTADETNADMLYSALGRNGQLLAGKPVPSELLPLHQGWYRTMDLINGVPQRGVALITPLTPDLWLVSGMQTRAEDGFLRVMLRNALLALAVAAVMSLLLGLIVARWVATRLHRIDHVIEKVGQGDLTARVESDGSRDAFDRVGERINSTLDRVTESMHAVRDVTDHIAHDLRTPLSRLRNTLVETRQTSTGHTADLVDESVRETDRILSTFASILRLSRIEHTPLGPNDTAVRLDILVADAVELYEPLAVDQGLHLESRIEPAFVRGDRDQLFQLITNLLDNAVKYSPTGTHIQALCMTDTHHALLQISDQGPGIPATDRDRVLERFTRLEAHRGSAGNGLGLSLVAAVVKRHAGSIELSENYPGLLVSIRLPIFKD